MSSDRLGHRRSRRQWSTSSEDEEKSTKSNSVERARKWHSTPSTPTLKHNAIPHHSSLLKVALKKAIAKDTELSQADATLLATFPTFHGISVAAGSPARDRKSNQATSHHQYISDSKDSSDYRDSVESLRELHGPNNPYSASIHSSSNDNYESNDSDCNHTKNDMGSEREMHSDSGKEQDSTPTPSHSPTHTHSTSITNSPTLLKYIPSPTFIPTTHYALQEGYLDSDTEKPIFSNEYESYVKDDETTDEETEVILEKHCIPVIKTRNLRDRDSSFNQESNTYKAKERESVLGSKEAEIATEEEDWSQSHEERNSTREERSWEMRQTICHIEDERASSESKEYYSGQDIEENYTGKGGRKEKIGRSRKQRKSTCRQRSAPASSMLKQTSRAISQGRSNAFSRRKNKKGSKSCSDIVADNKHDRTSRHSDSSTHILLNLIQELENEMCETDENSPDGIKSRKKLLSGYGMCLNVAERRSRYASDDHLNQDVSVSPCEDKASPSDFFTELTQILDLRLRETGTAQLSRTQPLEMPQPGRQLWKLIKSMHVVNPLVDSRYRTIAPLLTTYPSLYPFAVSLGSPFSEPEDGWPESRWPLCPKELARETQGLPAWLQQALKILPPGVNCSTMDSSSCLELALEGERLCKAGDCRAGVAFFEAAIQTGTDDLRTLSAIYSQLGNAYFYLGEYDKAMDYHKLDLTVARTMGDRLGVAKASGNLGNTLKVMGKFKEAICCCERHLSISQELQDKVGEGRALYNLGNVYHAQGKHLGRIGPQEPGGFSDEVKHCLQKAVEYYAANLRLMEELNDRSAQGRACGNLGNTHYLLGNFTQAINYHSERLAIAKEFGDKAAERRAHSNLGNAHIFLGEFETAAEHYKKTLQLAQELGDRAVEAQACYSLGNTYTLLRDYPTAIHYHLRHLAIAEELADKVGEGRACWSLGNAYSATNNNDKALHYATRHLQISKEIGDKTGQAAAQMNLSDIRKVLGLPSMPHDSDSPDDSKSRARRKSMENMDLLKMTPDAKGVLRKYQSEDAGIGSLSSDDSHPVNGPYTSSSHVDLNKSVNEESSMDDDSFFELLSRFQSKRMDDQRCTLSIDSHKESNNTQMEHKPQPQPPPHREPAGSLSSAGSTNGTSTPSDSGANNCGVLEELMESIAGMQSRRMDEQRASLPKLPGLTNQHVILQRLSVAHADTTPLPDDNFFDMLMRCQGSRIEDQRSSLPNEGGLTHSAPTVPDDDFFSLIMRFQSGRLEDQRSTMPPDTPGTRPAHQDSPATPGQPASPSQSAPPAKDGLVSRLVKSRK